MTERSCGGCGYPLSPGDQTCSKCGRAASLAPNQEGVPCKVCGALINAYTLRCPDCGEAGYPALRPRRGRGSQGSPNPGS